MTAHSAYRGVLFWLFLEIALCTGLSAAETESAIVTLPPGVSAVWDQSRAYHESTPTRECLCLNGLWLWQPAANQSTAAPQSNWGYFKVPGSWPGITDYMQKDSQTVYAHPSWSSHALGDIKAAWYQREITVPQSWKGRRTTLFIEYLNSYSAVYINGKLAGEVRFPSGEIDLTSSCQPGTTNLLTLMVVAMPLQGVLLSYTDSASAREVKGSVARRGLCGDVYLFNSPVGPRLEDGRVQTSVRRRECRFDARIERLEQNERYSLLARIRDSRETIHEFVSPTFEATDLKQGRISFATNWVPDRLWDTDTPQNLCTFELSLLDSTGNVRDTSWPTRFGFREFWIDGRDFFLNGKRIYLSAVPLDNAQVSVALATYDAARESLQRLQSLGINFIYTHNYDCLPGSHLGFEEILRAADDVGMLVAFTQPHFSHYDWRGADADKTNGYFPHASFYVSVAQNHPSVILYSMSHNATGYEEDMNPAMIDGTNAPRDTWSLKNCSLALRAEAIVTNLDPTRIVYHHSSGNLGSMHTANFYPNFAPIQELSDWFEHWATHGVKPMFTCEYGAPFTWDWTMYRGWYKGQREFGSAAVPWEFCVAEWNAQFFGDRAFQISEAEKANLRWEAKQFRAGKLWHRWDYPNEVGSPRFEERYPVFERYLTDNWRAFRTWGVSAISPWEFEHFWKLRPGVDKTRQEFKVDWANLQRPGFSPDYLDARYERMDLAFKREDWIPTSAAQALIRNNRPLLAYLAGKPARFTSKEHNFVPGEKIAKQLILINNSRQPVTATCAWKLELPKAMTGTLTLTVEPGGQQRVPLSFELPASLKLGTYPLRAEVRFSNGETQTDTLDINVLAPPDQQKASARIALFDPRGETAALLQRLGIQSRQIEATADLSSYEVIIIGKAALTPNGAAPALGGVRDGLKVLLFEQTSEALSQRLGFRTEEYGLRRVFARIPDHPALAGLSADNLSDWRGAASLLPPQLDYQLRPRYGPTVQWCGLQVTRLWRCGNQGNVASVLIEKPGCGDFLPLADGGYNLQYSPLLEYREGKGLILFCQMDVTGRTEADPAAERLVKNLLQYVSTWKPAAHRRAVYAGDTAGKAYLETNGVSVGTYEGGSLSSGQVLIVGPGGSKTLATQATRVAQWLKSDGHLLTIGLGQDELGSWLPFQVATKSQEHISTFFTPPPMNSLLAGIAPADLHNRDPRNLPLVSEGAQLLGDGVLAVAPNYSVVLCQFAPWQFESPQQNLRRTYRRLSFTLSRLLANMGVGSSTPLLERFQQPLHGSGDEKRWLSGLYVDQPEEWDDPYRFFRW
ncbi:MAG TPA: glycoside hydrolase family 2 TIM barrel-domain containing protein [Candidatus Limnocylindrales bacterium]|nr:glycoside hydrolase family 2 TIM barrel-domain containing protein [Candidatus Limnocylindrales bacterium]